MSAAPDDIVAIVVRVGVNFGDHAETVWNALTIEPDETVRALMERALPARAYADHERYDGYVRLAFARREGVHLAQVYGQATVCSARVGVGAEACGRPEDDSVHLAVPGIEP